MEEMMDSFTKVVIVGFCTTLGFIGCGPSKIETSDDEYSLVTLEGTKVSDQYRVFESASDYLERVDLDSLYFADMDSHVESTLFAKLLDSLVPQDQVLGFPSAPYYLNMFTDHPASLQIALTRENLKGFSISAYGEDGIHHFFFKQEGKTYRRIPKLDNHTHEALSFRELTLLHFASFNEAPRTSGIVTLHRSLNADQLTVAESWTPDEQNTKLIDGIYSGRDLNIGVAYLDDSPDGGTSCGGRCKVPTTKHSVCRVKTDGVTFYCKPVGNDGSCLGHHAMDFALANNLETEIDLPKFRKFDNEYLSQSQLGRKYLEYIPLLDAHLKLDLASMVTYSDIFPDLYRMMDTLMDPSVLGDTVVINDVLYQKAIDILAEYDSVNAADFRAMGERMKKDLESTRGLSKSELVEWIRHQ